jgi:hypothetical protein
MMNPSSKDQHSPNPLRFFSKRIADVLIRDISDTWLPECNVTTEDKREGAVFVEDDSRGGIDMLEKARGRHTE